MSARAKAIKQRLKAQVQARKDAGGEWARRGECKRCGACCDARNVNPESYRERAEKMMRDTGRVLSSICGNHGVMKDGQLGCRLWHRRPRVRIKGRDYPPGCEAFPATPEDWYLVADSCGYWFDWVADTPRKAGKARRRKRG